MRCLNGHHRNFESVKICTPQFHIPKYPAEKILASCYVRKGQDKPITILFRDRIGSSALAERLEFKANYAWLNRFLESILN
jgi:hypothetical protein